MDKKQLRLLQHFINQVQHFFRSEEPEWDLPYEMVIELGGDPGHDIGDAGDAWELLQNVVTEHWDDEDYVFSFCQSLANQLNKRNPKLKYTQMMIKDRLTLMHALVETANDTPYTRMRNAFYATES